MKNTILILIIFPFFLLGCKKADEKEFPKEINTQKTEVLKRIKGTRIFVSYPDDYKPMENLLRLQKDDDTYFQVIEFRDVSTEVFKERFSKESLEAKGQVNAYQEVLYNGSDAVYTEAPLQGQLQVALAIVKKNCVVMMVGMCKIGDREGKKELQSIIESAFYDEDYQVDPFELVNFEFDKTITGFEYRGYIGNMYFYSPDNDFKIQEVDQPTKTNITFMTLSDGKMENMVEFLYKIVSNLEKSDRIFIDHKSISEQSIRVGVYPAYEMTMKGEDRFGIKFTVYLAVLLDEGNSGVLFAGYDADNGKYAEKIKQTMQSIKIKKWYEN